MLNRCIQLTLFIVLALPVYQLSACDTTFRVVREGREDVDELFARRVIEKAGCKVEVYKPDTGVVLNRRLVMLREGIIDLIVGVSRRPERESYGYFSKPFRKELVRVWTKKGDEHKFQDFSLETFSAKGIKLLGPSTGWYGSGFETLRSANNRNLVLFTNIPHGLDLLFHNRGDVLLGADNFEPRFPEKYKEQLVLLPPIIFEDTIHFMYSKKTVPMETVKLIDKVLLEELSESPPAQSEGH